MARAFGLHGERVERVGDRADMVEQAALRERGPGEERDTDPAPPAERGEQQALKHPAGAGDEDKQDEQGEDTERAPCSEAVAGTVPPRFETFDDPRK